MYHKPFYVSTQMILGLKWFAILNTNMAGSLKLLPLFIIIIALVIQGCKDSISRIGTISALSICILIVMKFFQTSVLAEGATSFEGISFVYLIVVLPFLSSDRRLINKNEPIFILAVLYSLTLGLVVDLILRVSIHGITTFFNPLIYTLAKFDGLYTTSNVAGSIAVISIALSLHYKRPVFLTMNFLLLLFTLSRVSILASLIVVLYHVTFVSRNKFYKFFVVIVFMLIIIFYVEPLTHYVLNDGSFKSKINLFFIGFEKFFQNDSFITTLFGMGINASNIANLLGLNGWSPHLSSLKALLYLGVLGLFVWVAIHSYAFWATKLKSIVVAGLIMGLAGLPIVWPGILFSLLFYRKKIDKSTINNSGSEAVI